VKTAIPDFDGLNLPSDLSRFCSEERGIVLVAGATNSGKTTTLAAMVNHINENFRKHIVTVEDPIEYLYQDRLSIINQREVGVDTDSFRQALKHVLRQDPDTIVIGEMRDSHSFTAALQSAETGHLVLSTIHSSSAANAIDRTLDFFGDSESRTQARFQLAHNLVVVVCQRLIPAMKTDTLVPVIEVMTASPLVRKLILGNQLNKLPQAIQSGQESDMITFNQSILKLIRSGVITEEVGLTYSSSPDALRMNLQGIFLESGKIVT
jgi:twitching motility protein PilT